MRRPQTSVVFRRWSSREGVVGHGLVQDLVGGDVGLFHQGHGLLVQDLVGGEEEEAELRQPCEGEGAGQEVAIRSEQQ